MTENQLPYGTVEVSESVLYQADCLRCGWHTRQFENRDKVDNLANLHFHGCPNPKPKRHGARVSCGCWHYAMPGDAAGMSVACPKHGSQTYEQMNVDEPTYGTGQWTHV